MKTDDDIIRICKRTRRQVAQLQISQYANDLLLLASEARLLSGALVGIAEAAEATHLAERRVWITPFPDTNPKPSGPV